MPAYEAAKAKEGDSLAAAKLAEETAATSEFKDAGLNSDAEAKIAAWRADHKKACAAKKKTTHKPHNSIPSLIGLCIFMILIFGAGIHLMGMSFGAFAKGFGVVCFSSLSWPTCLAAKPSPSSTGLVQRPGPCC